MTAYKWAKEITHFVNGGEVEYILTSLSKTKGLSQCTVGTTSR